MFMIVGLKQSVPLVVRAVPGTTISGEYVHSLQAFGVLYLEVVIKVKSMCLGCSFLCV